MPEPTSFLKSPIRVGVVGLGRAGWDLHFQVLAGMPEFEVAGVVDPARERCEQARGIVDCLIFESLEEMLQDPSIELVALATPTQFHYRGALQVLQSGRHCILEKPMALSAVEADELVAVAKARQVRLFV